MDGGPVQACSWSTKKKGTASEACLLNEANKSTFDDDRLLAGA